MTQVPVILIIKMIILSHFLEDGRAYLIYPFLFISMLILVKLG